MNEKRHKCRILHPNILCVAVETLGGWYAYIGIVPGRDIKQKWRRIYRSRNKLPQEVAEALFPGFKHLEWTRK